MPQVGGPNGWQARQRTIKMSLSVQKFCLYQASSVKKICIFHKTQDVAVAAGIGTGRRRQQQAARD